MKAKQVSTWTLTPAQRARVRNNLGLVASYLRRSTTIPPQPMSRCEYDDLFQEGTLGLMRAAVRYDPARDKTFAAFALKHIHGAVSRALAERFATIRVPVKRVKEAGRRHRERGIEQAKGDSCRDRGTFGKRVVTTANLADEDVLLRDHRAEEPPLGRKLGDLLRDRCVTAVRTAGERVLRRGRGRADRGLLIEHLMRDRLLIPEEGERTPLREIARQLGCTAGRVLACERQIAKLAAGILQKDPVYARIRELAVREAESLGLVVDERLGKELAWREERHFAERIERLGEADLDPLLGRLAGQVCGSSGRLALLLFRALGQELRTRVLMELTPGADSASAA